MSNTITLGPFSGMNNLAADHALPQGSTEYPRAAVRNAVNVDFDNAGKPRRRKGCVKRYSGLFLSGGFSCASGMFVVETGILKSIDKEWTATSLLEGVTGDIFAFCEFNGVVFFSDGTKAAKISGGSAAGWGMTNPPPPVVYTGAGIFGAGVYLYALTYVDDAGNESGASEILAITAGADSSFVFNSLPSSHDRQVVATRVYMSTANGDVLYQAAEVARGVSGCTIILDYDGGKELQTIFMTKPPSGQIITEYKGRMVIASGNMLVFSEPFSTDLVSQLGKDKFVFAGYITVVEPVEDGIWIVADKTYFLAGSGPDDFIQTKKLEYGAALGTSQKIPNTKNITWFSTRGQIVAGNSGEIKNVQEQNVAPDISTSGAMIIRESDGIQQAITVLKNPTMSPIAAQSFIDMEVTRRATT